MTLEQRLQATDDRIARLHREIDRLYEQGAAESVKDGAFDRLEDALRERDALRRRFAGQPIASGRELVMTWETLREEIVRIFRRTAQRLAAIFNRFPAPPRQPTIREVYAGASAAPSCLKPAQFAGARPANRRPWLPGHMIQKGRG